MNRAWMRALAALLLIGSSSMTLSCNVNDYCLNCGVLGDGGNGDSLDGNDGGDDDAGDGGDGGNCMNTGVEVCDNKDNDCDGMTDEGTLPTVGDQCQNQVGECMGGVKQCTNGVITCTKPPMPEICDLKDNDCNGTPDDGDPGGGAVCGTSVGECVAGTNRCVSGTIQCVGASGTVGGQPETCNNRDDDCDGKFDEMIGVIGPCPTGTNTGECNIGNLMCVGGTPTCVGAITPSPELCDALDQDCDGNNTNGFNLMSDPQNCGMCGNSCNLAAQNAFAGCGGNPVGCTIAACFTGFHNNDGMVANGCEYGPCTISGNEVCDGMDNDCNPNTTEAMLTPPANLCLNVGECMGATTSACLGAQGFKCTYTDPDVSLNMPNMPGNPGIIVPETLCDGKDNDCDGRIDEGQPNKGQSCDNGMIGGCRSSGTFQCDSMNLNGPAVCVYTQVGTGAAPESCDGIDNNCNGQTDEGAATGNLPGQEWVNVPGLAVQMMKYEASRPDSGTVNPGTLQNVACSRQGVQPWTNVNYPTAVNACASIGARLCSEAEWQHMCEPKPAYPVTGPATTGTTDFTFIQAEDALANTTIGGRTWTRISPTNFNGVTAMQVPDTGFSQLVAANALTQSSRLDYSLSLMGATSYRMWLRMRSPAPSTTNVMRTPTAPVAGVTGTANAATQVGDLVIVTTWSPTTVTGIPTHTIQAGFTQIISTTLDDGANDGRLSVAYRVATVAGAQTYQAYVSSGTSNVTGLNVMRAGSFNTANIVSGGVANTTTNAPNPPAVTLNGPMTVFAIGAWNLTASSTVAVGAPANGFVEEYEVAGANTTELSVAIGSVADPGAFTDDTANVNGTVGITIGIGVNIGNSVWVGLNPGATAGAANGTSVATTLNDTWQWVVGPALTSGAAGTHTFSIYLRDDGVIVDTIAISRQATTAPTFDDSWAYQTNPRTPQPTTCNADDFDTDPVAAGDQDGIVPTGSLPACFANQTGTNDAFDMSGNVKEWTQARGSGQNPLRGGASNNEVPGTTCSLNFTLANDAFFFPNVGFRCCR
ncbi:MAG: hypothetical protein H0T46_34305 [Deltaproteobacteria bacterium]|nr:hypothetical protein [Deltaproteobacteria bacterium]